jgi:hypothetical protein
MRIIVPEVPARPKEVRQLRVVLTHVSGPFRGETHSIDKKRFLVGGGEASDVRLNADPASVPRAEIFLDEFDYHLRDLGSGDRTFVNSRQVGEIMLVNGDLLEFGPGGPKLRFRLEAADGEVRKPVPIVFRDCVRRAGRFGEAPGRALFGALGQCPADRRIRA